VKITEEFLEAVQSGNTHRVRTLLESDRSLVDVRNAAGLSALLVAVYHGHRGMIDLLLLWKSGLDLFEASAVGRVERVMELVQEDPARVNGVSPDGFSPLGLASFFGHPKVVAYLIEQGADVNAASKNPMRVCPLHSALAHRQPEVSFAIAEMLVGRGADVNAMQAGGWTPLHQAAMHGQVNLATLLLDQGADVNAKAENGKTALELAMAGKHKGMIALLREKGAI